MLPDLNDAPAGLCAVRDSEFDGAVLSSRKVTVAAGALQKAGLISYTRGSVKILSRKKLEDAACDCYGIVQRQLTAWEAEAN